MRSTDRVARFGGDEFAILLPEIEYDAAVETAKKISTTVENRLAMFPPVTASLGVAWFPIADRPFEVMVKAADELMYEAKKTRKGSTQYHRFEIVPTEAKTNAILDLPNDSC